MKKIIVLLLALVFSLTVMALPLNVFASSTQVVSINGVDRLEITNIKHTTEMPAEQGFDSQYEFVCGTGAKLTTLEDKAITLVFYGADTKVAPDNYTTSDLNANGEFVDLPKGSSYTFTAPGMYFYSILFMDNTSACGYIEIDDSDVYFGDETPSAVVPQPQDTPAQKEEAQLIPVVSKAQRVQIEEEWADVDAYNIFDNNYIKLRDFAYYYSMFGTFMDKYFDVTWDGEKNAINLVTGKAYTAVGGEGALNAGVSAQATLSSASVYLNGEPISLTAYTINDNNYFKLRDLCEAFNISISWWEVQQTIYINNDYPYGTEFPEDVPDAL